MRKGLLIVSSFFLALVACRPLKPVSQVQSETGRIPEECVGGEFAIRGFNQTDKRECLDVVHYPTLNHVSDPVAYQKLAERLGMSRILDIIRTRGVTAAQREYQLVANFKHQDSLWVAQIPTGKKAVRAVFQVSEFGIPLENALKAVPPDVRTQIEEMSRTNPVVARELEQLKTGKYTAAHGQLRVQFSEMVQLVDPKNVAHRNSLSEIILSVHAASQGSAPDTYDPLKGMQNAYGTALGVYSVDDKVNQSIVKHIRAGREPSRVRQYLLDLAPEKIDSALVAYFRKAKSVWDNLAYNTVSRNCGSEIFEILDEVNGYDKSKDDVLSGLGRQYPKYAQFGLLRRGLVALKTGESVDAVGMFRDEQLRSPLPTLNKEMSYPEPK